MYATDVVYSDLDLKQIESLPDTQLHRNVDLFIVDADKQGECRAIRSVLIPDLHYSYMLRLCEDVHYITVDYLWSSLRSTC
jgi:hypothetical protein